MRASRFLPFIAIGLAVCLSACGMVEAARQAQEQKQQAFVKRVDTAHVWVTTESPPPGKPYQVLGQLSYTVPFSPDAIEESTITDKLKQMAMAKWPDNIDAVVKVNQDVSNDGSEVTVTGEAIQYDQSVDRNALRHMNEGLVASPSGNQ